jgi:hypothetical protein
MWNWVRALTYCVTWMARIMVVWRREFTEFVRGVGWKANVSYVENRIEGIEIGLDIYVQNAPCA